ncbi:hypothetical protein JIP62_06330 [Brevundimonas vitis]|uniref:Uncharacterized protein n=1 Tax=Brevundimonas vitisensis TaxID=2800818 RepID=A0ABX7BR40_9CAUL|nr:hypothetical protein [Brevundimonas vitisensis]QQQ19701.1 hypothetical protein JIP62_06330 [Brevundimonas vitisensis]
MMWLDLILQGFLSGLGWWLSLVLVVALVVGVARLLNRRKDRKAHPMDADEEYQAWLDGAW